MLAAVAGAQQPFEELVTHLTRTSPLSPGEAARLIAEVVGYFSEPAEEFVRRRHGELKARGLTNDRAFHADRGRTAATAGGTARSTRCASCAGSSTADGGQSMCGIVAHVGSRDCVPILLEGLARLEYRGYDSAGLAVVSRSGEPARPQGQGPGRRPRRRPARPVQGQPGNRAHPVGDARRAERRQRAPARLRDRRGRPQRDHRERRRAARQADRRGGRVRLGDRQRGARAPHRGAAAADDLEAAVRQALTSVVGTYGIAVLDARYPDRIVAARNGSPVVLGHR